ncbi:hypothetical protein K7X08_009652 [Anisodus acutangulus]|uniref:Uncharacterized protein n=1 Tax=Anisodus acutangulus TaxID=402998 RepID=A0A9Q1RUD1_9SOLA|nr:hypothetical protein K7X08_009652 [Anisodus acutangulus]
MSVIRVKAKERAEEESEAKDSRRRSVWLTTTNNHVGRQHWKFDTEAGTPEAHLTNHHDNCFFQQGSMIG